MEINTVYLSLGSNIGDRQKSLCLALKKLNLHGKINQVSKVYETASWGFDSSDKFLNICIELSTQLSPLELLDQIHEIENELGRIRSNTNGYESRSIDIDIVFFNQLKLENERLTIPHKEYTKRAFVLFPLSDLALKYVDPTNELTVEQHLSVLLDPSDVQCLQITLNC
jgi:2-amino-4-hydroxy-6-hydroxymethyldihydropteridine diphosphokinase